MITLLMRCGHDIAIDPDKVTSPSCWCGERVVARPLSAPAPRIVGHARGPLVEGKYLGPTALDLVTTPDARLVLKPADDGEQN